MHNFLHKQYHSIIYEFFSGHNSVGMPLLKGPPCPVLKLTENHKNLRALELDNQDIFGDGNAISSLARMEVTFTHLKRGKKAFMKTLTFFWVGQLVFLLRF